MIDQESIAKLEAGMTALAKLEIELGALHATAKVEYARLLDLPYDCWERFYAMRSLPFLRDFIAACEGRESEAVQAEYEASAALKPVGHDGPNQFPGGSPDVFPPEFGGKPFLGIV